MKIRTDLAYLLDECVSLRDKGLDAHSSTDAVRWDVAAMMCVALDNACAKMYKDRMAEIANMQPGPLVSCAGSYEDGFAAGIRSAMALAKVKP